MAIWQHDSVYLEAYIRPNKIYIYHIPHPFTECVRGVRTQKRKSAVIMLKRNQNAPYSTSIKEMHLGLFAIYSYLPSFRADIPAIQQEQKTQNF